MPFFIPFSADTWYPGMRFGGGGDDNGGRGCVMVVVWKGGNGPIPLSFMFQARIGDDGGGGSSSGGGGSRGGGDGGGLVMIDMMRMVMVTNRCHFHSRFKPGWQQ